MLRYRRLHFSIAILIVGAIVALGQNVIRWQDAANYYGQIKIVEGTIVETKNTGKVCFLNFSPNWRTDFTAVIFASDFSKFPANQESYCRGKKVRVTGNIQEYRGKPEIILKNRNQIVLVVRSEKPQGSALAPQVEAAPAYAARQPAVPASASNQTVYVTKTGSKYHRAGCSSLSKSMMPMALDRSFSVPYQMAMPRGLICRRASLDVRSLVHHCIRSDTFQPILEL